MEFTLPWQFSVQIKWSSGRPDAQNCRRTTWTSQQVIRGMTRLTSPELEFDFENLFHLFWSASTFEIEGFQHYFPPLNRVDCSAGIGISSHPQRQEMFKIPYHCSEECLQGVTPPIGTFVQSGVQWQHWYIPHNMVVGLMWIAWWGASLSCGMFFLWCQFVKIGFRMKVHWFMTTKWLLCVTYNLHKFKIHIFTPHDWK